MGGPRRRVVQTEDTRAGVYVSGGHARLPEPAQPYGAVRGGTWRVCLSRATAYGTAGLGVGDPGRG